MPCALGVRLRQKFHLASDLHMLEDNKARRLRRSKAFRELHAHENGESAIVSVVLPDISLDLPHAEA